MRVEVYETKIKNSYLRLEIEKELLEINAGEIGGEKKQILSTSQIIKGLSGYFISTYQSIYKQIIQMTEKLKFVPQILFY